MVYLDYIDRPIGSADFLFGQYVQSLLGPMSTSITRRATVPELSRQVLEMATTGVYRESIFEALQPIATKKNIRLAIAHAKQYGLHSVADLRDEILGTYYQVDLAHYQVSRDALKSPLVPDDPAQAVQLATDMLSTLKWVVRLSLFSAVMLVSVGLTCGLLGYGQLRGGLWVGALFVIAIWHLQRRLLKQFLVH